MYEAHFGFRESPFQITPDPRFLFLTQSHRDALTYLMAGVTERKGILVLTGEVGTGKTLMVRTLMERLPEDVQTAIVMNARLTFEQLLYLALLDFGVPPKSRSKVDQLITLQEHLLRLRDQGRTAFLTIDEAQTLTQESLEELRLLSNLETTTEKLFQILLVGQPELKATLNQHSLRQLRQRIPGIFDLSRVPAESVWEYVEYRIQIASDGRCSGLFNKGALEGIVSFSKGIPRLINQVCDRALLVAYAWGVDQVDKVHVREAVRDLEGGFLGAPRPETLRNNIVRRS